ncbi:MAG: ABC transporter permease [bacterium]|nr:ABC transporter permease [bacterium]
MSTALWKIIETNMAELFRLPQVSWSCLRVWQRDRDAYMKYYKLSLLGSLGDPLLYLLAMGYGLGRFLEQMEGMSYMAFIAPGLVISSAMFSASFECTYSAFLRMIYMKTYDAILATPLTIEDVVAGDILWGTTKGFLNGMIMFLVIAAVGLVDSAWAVAIPLLIIVVSFLFASMAMMVTSFVPTFEAFNYYITLFLTPMFFFSGVFFPLTRLPDWVATLSNFLPLTYAVGISRALIHGTPSWLLVWGTLVLLVPALLFFWLAMNLIKRRVIK